jgi:hypothetical protein
VLDGGVGFAAADAPSFSCCALMVKMKDKEKQ